MSNELEAKVVLNADELDTLIWQNILSWLNNQTDLPEDIRQLIAKRADQLRLKMQVVFMELQRRYVSDIALDVEFESELRKEMRKSFPFLSSKEQSDVLKTFSSTNEDRIKRLENQLQGFDLFSNIEYAIQTLTSPIPTGLTEQVKKLSPGKRQQLMTTIEGIKAAVEKEPFENMPQAVAESVDETVIEPNEQ